MELPAQTQDRLHLNSITYILLHLKEMHLFLQRSIEIMQFIRLRKGRANSQTRQNASC